MPNSHSEVNWKKMVDFAERLAYYGIQYGKKTNLEEQRISVVLLDQSMEIMMKAFLISRNYEVFYLKEQDVKNGVKKSESFEKALTMDFRSALNLVKDELANVDKDAINHFHEIRNKVYHGAAVTLQENKEDAISNYLPKIEQFYNLAFPGRTFETNVKNMTT